MKKVCSIVLAAVLMFSLAACTDKNADTSTDNNTTTEGASN